MSDKITVAFAGSGEVTQAGVRALLNDYLGFGEEDADGWPAPSDKEITLIFPSSPDHDNPTMSELVEWSEYVDLPYDVVTSVEEDNRTNPIFEDANSIVQPLDVNQEVISLLTYAQSDGDEGVLILAWGNEGDAVCQELLDLADNAGIRALDLTARLDHITYLETTEDGSEATDVPDGPPLALEPEIAVAKPLEAIDTPLEEAADTPAPSVTETYDRSKVSLDDPEHFVEPPEFVTSKRAQEVREAAEANTPKSAWDDLQDQISLLAQRVAALEKAAPVVEEEHPDKFATPKTRGKARVKPSSAS